uniref:Uncharacterized protein n=1 Tax=Cereibacter sphaeroides (strain ATCC 17025 / ATH 2.4.3) TaxID=349102 RepID=A4WYD5_CERS5
MDARVYRRAKVSVPFQCVRSLAQPPSEPVIATSEWKARPVLHPIRPRDDPRPASAGRTWPAPGKTIFILSLLFNSLRGNIIAAGSRPLYTGARGTALSSLPRTRMTGPAGRSGRQTGQCDRPLSIGCVRAASISMTKAKEHSVPYLTVRKDDLKRINAYFEACDKSGIPFIRCENARTRATVTFDHASLSREDRQRLCDRHERLGEGVVAIADRAAEGLPRGEVRYKFSTSYAEILNLPIDRGEAAAEALDALIRELIAE